MHLMHVHTLVHISKTQKRVWDWLKFERRCHPTSEENIREDGARLQRCPKNLQTLRKTTTKVLNLCACFWLLYCMGSRIIKLANYLLTSVLPNTLYASKQQVPKHQTIHTTNWAMVKSQERVITTANTCLSWLVSKEPTTSTSIWGKMITDQHAW